MRIVYLATFLLLAIAQTPGPNRADCPAGHLEFNSKQWAYGPASLNWGALCPSYSTCNTGSKQSPINIPSNAPVTSNQLVMLYSETDLNLVRVDQLVSMPVSNGANQTIWWNGRRWQLQHIEFHYPSEHSINGVRADLEVQLYHSSLDQFNVTSWVAVSVLFTGTADKNPFIETLWPRIPLVTTCKCGNGRTENYNIGATNIFGEQCDCGALNARTADMCRPDCKLAMCGDGIVDRGEECDLGSNPTTGNSNTRPNACRANCTKPRCGDLVVDAGEQCDVGTQIEQVVTPILPKGGCDPFCQFNCGNGRLDPYLASDPNREQCDNGPLNSDLPGAACRTNCLIRRCGDGIVDPGEQCDDGGPNGTLVGGNGCLPGCILPRCGDGVLNVKYNETCDNGALSLTPYDPAQPIAGRCNGATCKLWCGDGIVQRNNNGEDCDNGILNSDTTPNACRTTCRNATCGDGVVDNLRGEQCDPGPGNPLGTFACFPNCTWRCGNGRIDPLINVNITNEQCDNGLGINGNSDTRPNACRLNCQLPRCGDRVIDPVNKELCDNGAANSDTVKDACRTNCKLPCCGDGVTDTGEECDHGTQAKPAPKPTNNYTGYNADPRNWGCSSDCKKLCGDGVRGNWDFTTGQGEQCDDGQLNSDSTPDKCRPNICRVHFCGDKIVDFDEECDDGPTGSDFCTSQCKKTYCGDGIIQKGQGEECDNGAANSYADASTQGCSPICTLNRCGLSQNLGTDFKMNLYDLLLSNPVDKTFTATPAYPGDFYYYQGSWTKPPCTENVEWLVLKQQQRIGLDQVTAFRTAVGANSRPIQDAAGRNFVNAWATPASLPSTYSCGNGILEPGEECDMGKFNSNTIPNRCRSTCKVPKCGDNVKDQGEMCDGESWCNLCKVSTTLNGRSTMVKRESWDYQFPQYWHHWNTTCTGSKQSPITIPTTCQTSGRPLSLNHPANMQYVQSPVVLFNTGTNILFPVFNGGSFSFHGKTYVLKHIEFHQPSEHRIGDKQYDFEVQLHHVAQNPGVLQNAALSILFDKGTETNAWLDKFWNQLPSTSTCQCGNGIKEDQFFWPDGRITKEECDAGSMNSDTLPNRCRMDCTMPKCGDGVIDLNEACDWGKANAKMGGYCRPDCTMPYCGDGIVDPGEQCDDGNSINIDACDNMCKFTCGNGRVEGNEECDAGVMNSDTKANACRLTCKKASCGDGIIDVGEECDLGAGNAASGSKCRKDCKLPICGDNIVDAGEQCDGTPGCTNTSAPCFFDKNGIRTCQTPCSLMCGNGKVDPGEECDDGAANSNTVPNACRTNCRLPKCGDGVRDRGEECDSTIPFGAAQPYCFNCKVVCGNGFLEQNVGGVNGYDEECDYGILNGARPNNCRTNCKLPTCGDGIVDDQGPCFEECDNGLAGNSDTKAGSPTARVCRTTCRWNYCGDGYKDNDEQCDDGNHLDGDGCSASCKLECGNGRLDPGEQCDDGAQNGMVAGCCRTNCQLPKCGDGVTDPGEECDDGPLNVDGPNTCRPNCKLPKCGDGVVDHMWGEKCDMGPLNSDTMPDGCSSRCTPNVCGQSLNPDIMVSPHDVIPTAPGVYCYDGSVNKPPCTENTQWFVFAAPQTISECQLNQWKRILPNNNRPVQPLNGRTVSWLKEDAKCGDGIVEGNEECDMGPQNSDTAPNACRRNCRKARCGDGVQDAGEQCDGTPNCAANCRLSCPSASGCPNCNATTATAGDMNVINVNFAK